MNYMTLLYGVLFLVLFFNFQIAKIRNPMYPSGLIRDKKLPSILYDDM
jgi:hypothetical protein